MRASQACLLQARISQAYIFRQACSLLRTNDSDDEVGIDRRISRATATPRNSDNEVIYGLKMRIPKTILGFGTNV